MKIAAFIYKKFLIGTLSFLNLFRLIAKSGNKNPTYKASSLKI